MKRTDDDTPRLSGEPSGKQRSWRFWVVCGYVAVVIVFGVVWLWSLFSPLSTVILAEQTANLNAVAHAGSLSLAETNRSAEDAAARLVEGTELRATIIARDGTVLGDSTRDASTLENHASRPEVIAALAGEEGSDLRMSASDGTQQLYVAVSAVMQGEQVVLRVSAPSEHLQIVTNSLRDSGLLLLGVGIIIAALVSWRAVMGASHPVERLERVRSDFVANASHELKTPVAGIRLLSDAITTASEEGDLATTRMFAGRLDNEATRLQHLVTDLLDLSRLESGTENMLVRTDLRAAVSTSFEAHRIEAQAKGLVVELIDETTPDDSCYVLMEASDASLIIDNLLDNAIRYTDAGSITVRIAVDDPRKQGSAVCAAQMAQGPGNPAGCVVLEVRDSGIGVAAAEQSRIFERFYRVDTARSRASGGTGLGLSLVRHAVKRGGGSIEVASTLGEGSTFLVRIPQA